MPAKKQIRDTRQRFALKRTIEEVGRPVGPQEILQLASKYVPNLGIATVYRNIKSMVDRGDLAVVELPGQASRYQMPGLPDDRLFICEKSDRVYSLSSVNGWDSKLPEGFKVKRIKVIYYGEAEPDLIKPVGSVSGKGR